MARFTLAEVAELIGAELMLVADAPVIEVSGVATLQAARAGDLAFLANPRYRSQLQSTQATAVIVDRELSSSSPVNCLIHSNPYLAYAKLSHYFDSGHSTKLEGDSHSVDPSASISATAEIASCAIVGPGAVIMEGVKLSRGVEVGANVVVSPNVKIGPNTRIMPNVTIYHGCVIGANVTLHAGSVIGADGFGYAPEPAVDGAGYRWQKIAQLGVVRIGDRVEVGANTTIDRGALDDTIIEDDVIIDNQVQIAHNVHIGKGTAIAGCVGIAGSTRIGQYCSIGGGSGIAGHLNIADHTNVLGMTLINRSVKAGATYASGTGMQLARDWRKSAVRFTQLEQLAQRIKALEKRLDKE